MRAGPVRIGVFPGVGCLLARRCSRSPTRSSSTRAPARRANSVCRSVPPAAFGTTWGSPWGLCPLQFDIVDRLIVQFSQPGELVFDPFGGLMTVPYCALKLGRQGLGIELNPGYFADGVTYCQAAAHQLAMPTLFDLEATG